MKQEDRRKLIIAEATRLFAQSGFDANTRELAQRLGITQPLLYRYFPSKESLIDAVLDQLFIDQSRQNWVARLTDRDRPLRDRLCDFAYGYATDTYDHDWIRIYMFAGLAGGDFNRRYIATVTEPVLRTISREIRAELGMPTTPGAVSHEELDYLWLFHGGLYYSAIRQHIYGQDVDRHRLRALADISVDAMLQGMGVIVARKRLKRPRKSD